MERYTMVLDEHVAALQNTEPIDQERLERMTHGAEAMRDSSLIYLSYANLLPAACLKAQIWWRTLQGLTGATVRVVEARLPCRIISLHERTS